MNNDISFTRNELIYGNQIDKFLCVNKDNDKSDNNIYYQMFPSIEKQIINIIINEYGYDNCIDIFLQLAEHDDILSNYKDKNKINNLNTIKEFQNNNISVEYTSQINDNMLVDKKDNKESKFSLSRLFKNDKKGNYKKINNDDLLQIGDDDDL